MTTQPVSTVSPNQIRSKKLELKAEDFIKIMVMQLQHQDPLEPAKNHELLAQMSQIGQLQASSDLRATLSESSAELGKAVRTLILQNQIGSASQLIGKLVAGLDDRDRKVSGLVTSVAVNNDQVYLELDNGQTLRVDRITAVAPQRS